MIQCGSKRCDKLLPYAKIKKNSLFRDAAIEMYFYRTKDGKLFIFGSEMKEVWQGGCQAIRPVALRVSV